MAYDIGGVKPLIHQSELKTYTKVVLFKEKSSFRSLVFWKILTEIYINGINEIGN